ncbi:MAG TPA: transcriptional regulator [Desulfurococcales archaeon]|nr:transcriptional regulator [Desulfurococcales archaeon]
MSKRGKNGKGGSLLEELFSSKGRVKVLKALLKLEEANITRIVKEVDMHHRVVQKHLEKLVSLGIVEEKRYGRLRFFRLNFSNPKIRLIKTLIEIIEE